MATLGSKLVTKEMQWNANMTEQNHLGANLLSKPQKIGWCNGPTILFKELLFR